MMMVEKIYSSLMSTGDGKSVGFMMSCPWTVLVASKMRKFTSEFYKVLNYSGNVLLQVENVIFTRLGFVFCRGSTVWSCRTWSWGHLRILIWFSIQFLRFLRKGCNMCFGIQACKTVNVFKMVSYLSEICIWFMYFVNWLWNSLDYCCLVIVLGNWKYPLGVHFAR